MPACAVTDVTVLHEFHLALRMGKVSEWKTSDRVYLVVAIPDIFPLA
jgi:hypothetical protein